MTTSIQEQLIAWASQYETVKFIESDPIQIPHRYTDKRDIEISAFVTAWIAWGNRKQIISKADFIDRGIFKSHPYEYIMGGAWREYQASRNSIYRTFRYESFASICRGLFNIYCSHEDMEGWIGSRRGAQPIDCISNIRNSFYGIQGIPNWLLDSCCKRLCLFLRWMCRNGPVDLGVWDSLAPADLIIPLDVHVMRMAETLHLLPAKAGRRFRPTMENAAALTTILDNVFPDDPCKGDFALFGAGVNKAVVPNEL